MRNIAPFALAVFQSRHNPDYPGAWAHFPKLFYFQPTFPAPGTRHVLKKGNPLTLHYRLCIRRGGKLAPETPPTSSTSSTPPPRRGCNRRPRPLAFPNTAQRRLRTVQGVRASPLRFVAQPKAAKWQHTVERLKKRWGIE